MKEIIATLTLFGSLFGIIVILIRKVPVLAELSIQESRKKTKKKTDNNNKLIGEASIEILLQKLLSRIRITTLKIENKTSNWLSKLRQKSLEKKNFSDNYWQKLIKRKK